jgi:hypothetical protein
VTRWQIVKFGYKTWRQKRRIEKEVRLMTEDLKQTEVWKPSQTAAKANAAAVPTGIGGLLATLILAGLHAALGDKWSAAYDGIVITIIAGAFTFWQTYRLDKDKHGGNLTPEEQAEAAVVAKAHAEAQTALYNEITKAAAEKRAAKEKEQPK